MNPHPKVNSIVNTDDSRKLVVGLNLKKDYTDITSSAILSYGLKSGATASSVLFHWFEFETKIFSYGLKPEATARTENTSNLVDQLKRSFTIEIQHLVSKRLKSSLHAIVEPDEDEFIARVVDLPLYGCGQDAIEAIEMLKREVESLYDDLCENNNFTPKWLKIKAFLKEKIA